jgi:tetratricopeptide (TPR) repeat protein
MLLVLATSVACATSADPDRAWREHFDAGKVAYSSGDAAEAERQFQSTLTIARLEQPPGLRTALSLNSLAVIYLGQGRTAEAEEPLREALELSEAQGEFDNEHFIGVLTNVGDLDLRLSHPADAERSYRRALELSRGLRPANPSLMTRSGRGVAAALCAQGRISEAESFGAEFQVACGP